ncbi:MAG: thiamine-phosphate kinase [Candidatus Omnitrophica bacterium]|nr:thiamine-phosphate kinase [Candidatus Omnitrophota bacterium]
MNVEKLGEFGLIERLSKKIKVGAGVVRGIGDDCAVVEGPPMWYHLFTCDMLLEGIHFKIPPMKPEAVGWKAIAASVSDIGAMGGIPQYATVALGVPKRFRVETLEGIYAGMQRMADQCGVSIVGGDTNRSNQLTLGVSMFGRVERTRLSLRSSAREGDHIFVTGKLGNSFKSGKHLAFTPRWQEARAMADHFPIHSMMDISDGLSSDLNHLARASRVGAVVDAKLIPCAKGATLKSALEEGEDFELLLTAPASVSAQLAEWAAGMLQCGLTRIGEIVSSKQGVTLLQPTGKKVSLPPAGWRHF